MVIELSEVLFGLYLIGRVRSVIITLVCISISLRSRRLEEVGERENGSARGRNGGSLSRASVFSCAHYFRAPATQAISVCPYVTRMLLASIWIRDLD